MVRSTRVAGALASRGFSKASWCRTGASARDSRLFVAGVCKAVPPRAAKLTS